MGFTSIPQALINVGKALVQPLFQYFKDNDDYLYGKIESMAASGVMNGSFELDTDLDGVPNNWTVDTYPGGQCGRMPSIVLGTDDLAYTCIADHTAADTNKPITGAQWATYWQQSGATTEAVTWASGKNYRAQNAAHGRFGLYFVHPGGPGNGGGYADSDYVPCSPQVAEVLGFIHWATNAAMKNQVYVRYYDKNKVYLSETQLYSSTSNPTSTTPFQYQFTPPVSARFVKVRLIGGYTDTDQVGTAYFDGLQTGRGSIDIIVPRKFAFVNWNTPSGIYTNIPNAMFKFYLPKGAFKWLVICVRCQRGTDGIGENYPIRFAVGSDYSNEYTMVYGAGWQLSDELKIDISNYTPGFYTVQFQFHASGVARSVMIHMDDADTINDPGKPGAVEHLVWLRSA
jgi:hypothetical protein